MAKDLELERKALAIFGALVDLDPSQRDIQLAQQCANNQPLLRRVKALLSVDEAVANTPSSLTDAAIVPPNSALPMGTVVGNYKISDTLGLGGMGAVYKAERADDTFERTVAIKFLHSNAWSEELHRRFDAERRIMSRLQHPNITALLDGGTTKGQPYLVMEYVEGKPFTHDSKLSTNTQLQRFVKVCAAVAHAHNNLILHRDIKPDNVLVDEQGQPKLLDFGIAKLSETVSDLGNVTTSELTGINPLPMTPQYTAPEVLAGEPASVASDIYALGLLLYEIITGKRPYELKGRNLIEAAQLAHKPVITKGLTPSQDINTIIGSALHRDSNRRYTSVQALQQDVTNVLQRRPIAARADNLFYTATRLVQRHLVGTLATLAALVTLVAMLASTLAASRESERQRLMAERHLQTAEYSTGFLLQTLSGASPLMGEKPLTTIDEALMAAEERLAQELPSDAYTQARLYSTLGAVFSGREDVAKAADYLRRAESVMANNPDLQRTVSLQTGISEAYAELGQPKAALAAANLAVAQRAASPDIYHLDFGRALLARAAARHVAGNYEGARADILEAMTILDRQDQDVAYEYASANMALGYIDGYFGRFAEAEQHIQSAINHLREAGLLDSANGTQAQLDHAQMLVALGRADDGIQRVQDLIEHMRNTLGPTHKRVLWSIASLGSLQTSIGKAADGVASMEPTLNLVEANHDVADELYAYYVAKLGYAMCRSTRFADGLVLLEKSLLSRQLVYPPDHWSIPDVELAIGYCHMQLGQDEEAVQVFNQAVDNFTRIFGPQHKQIEGINVWLAEIAARSTQPSPP